MTVPQRLVVAGLAIFLMACAGLTLKELNDLYGQPLVRDRIVADASGGLEFHRDIKPIFDQRCVVCHGCYDAPCQLKLSAFEAVDRGAHQEKVYDGTRLLNANLTRMFADASSTQAWRDKGFYPVLNEREQSPEANLAGSTLYRMLAMKQRHPLPDETILPDSFDFALDRDQQCTTVENFSQFESDYPLWGMPYGLPAISDEQFNTVRRWLEQGAVAAPRSAPSKAAQLQIAKWEAFFNGGSLKQQLVARYMYEHLYIANLYFPEVSSTEFYQLVRSRTPAGMPVDVIATRRPFDAPGASPFYYRLQPVPTTIVAKSHMPYRLDSQRLARWRQLFFTPDYEVTALPSYDIKTASNPFITFQQLPVAARYRFMLEEAKFTISGFIKGPVCRGQIALNVINDRFWVLFADPDNTYLHDTAELINSEAELLQLPAEDSSVLPLARWIKYSQMQRKYMQARQQKLDQVFPNNEELNLNIVWHGDGNNMNAALTVFRHFDSATVEHGLIGDVPKTAWLVGYPLLERIHYLLVAGFDVYGNVSHQLLTRLYMDFLRMEGESNFLSLLPADYSQAQIKFWYRGAESQVNVYQQFLQSRDDGTTGIDFITDNPKAEFFDRVKQRLGGQVIAPDPINQTEQALADPVMQQMQRLATAEGELLSLLPEISIVRVGTQLGDDRVYTLVRDVSHRNVSHLFGEQRRIEPSEAKLTVVEGILGSYPNSFYHVQTSELASFVDGVLALQDEAGYRKLRDRFAVYRSSPAFWAFSDWLHQYYRDVDPVGAGLLDFNRLENR